MVVERWVTSSVEDRESALISRRYGVPESFIQLLYWNWCSFRLEMGVSGNLWIVVKDVKQRVVYDVECEMAMDSMKGKCASSWVDLGYTNLFCIPEVTSVFFSCCDSVLGDSLLVPSGKSRFLNTLIGNTEHFSTKCRGIGPHLAERVKSHDFSRVAPGTWCIFSSYGGDAHLKLGFVQRSLDSCLGMTHTSGVKLCFAGKYRRFWRWAGRPSFPY